MNDFLNGWGPYIVTSFLTIIIGIRLYIAGKDCPCKSQIFGKIVLITGASGGLGLVTAKELAARGAQIIFTCRNLEKGEKAIQTIKQEHPSAKVVLKQLDVSLLKNIHKFVSCIEEEFDRIDVLINNAGIIFHPYEKTQEGFELTMATNYLGPFTLTHLLLPLLNKSNNGRVINVTAQAHCAAQLDLENLNCEKEFKHREIFAQTKLALLLFTRHLGHLLKSTKITVNAANPGLVRNTDHLRHSTMNTCLVTKISVWPWVWLFMKTPRQGSQTTVFLAVDPYINGISGGYFNDCELRNPSPTASDNKLATKLYEITCKMCEIDTTSILEKLDQTNVIE